MEPNLDTFHVWANSTDYATGASDAGYTLVDGGTLPYALSSDYDYFVREIHFTPRTTGDTFVWRLVTADSNKANPVQQSVDYVAVTGASVAGADHMEIDFLVPIEVNFSAANSYLGIAIDFSDTDALASFQVSGHRLKKHYL